MSVKEIRDHVAAARERIDAGDTEGARRHLDIVANQLAPDALLTTTEAAELLGIRSKNTIKAMARRGQIAAPPPPTTAIGDLIPMTEIARLQNAPVIHELRTIEHDYAAMAFPGSDDPVSDEEMTSLRSGETGTLPWRR